MRLQITHLKAPWPSGAVVGDVLDMPDIPAWASGKCVVFANGEIYSNATTAELIATGEGEGAGQPIPGIEAVKHSKKRK